MFLPMFPLEIVVFPGEVVPLHIFEPRYKQLIGECRDEGITFGIAPVIEGRPAVFGTEIALTKIMRTYDTGEMDILTLGQHVFHLREFHATVPEKLYSAGDVDLIENHSESDAALRENVITLFHDLHKLLKSNRRVDPDEAANLSFHIGHHAGLDTADKVKMLSYAREVDRLAFLRDHLSAAIPRLAESMKTRKKAGGNGHFKDFPQA
jgi:hypothetical protein